MFIRIEAELKAQGHTKIWLADTLGESNQNINNWKNRGVPANKVKAVADALGVTREYLEGSESRIPNVKKTRDTVVIDQMSAVGGMGAAVSIDGNHDTAIRTIELTKQYLSSQLGVISNPSNLRLVAGIGDSMKGVFDSRDTLFVDTGVTNFITEGVYMFHFDDHIWIKRLARNGKGGYTIISSNKEYDPVTVKKGDPTFKIIGLIVGVLNLNKLV